MLIFFLGFEVFGLPLILGDPQGLLVLSTYLYKLTNKLGVPSYQLMAVVVMVILLIALPLVFLQRVLLRTAQRYVSVRGKAVRTNLVRLAGWRWPAFGLIAVWFIGTVLIPMMGLILRSFVSSWGLGINLFDVLTLENYVELFDDSEVVHAIINTVLIATIGGALSVGCYVMIALAQHRWKSGWTRMSDYLVMLPRAMPGVVAGLAIFWIFLFVTPLTPLRTTLFAVWVAYTLVWLAYRFAARPELAASGRARARGGGKGRRCQGGTCAARHHPAAYQKRHGRRLDAGCVDFRARILHRRLPAWPRHRGDWLTRRLALGRRRGRSRHRAFLRQRRPHHNWLARRNPFRSEASWLNWSSNISRSAWAASRF